MQIFLANFVGTVVDQLRFAGDSDASSKFRVDEGKIPNWQRSTLENEDMGALSWANLAKG